MNKYIVRQPIKDAQKNILGFEILYQVQSDSLYNDYAAADTISAFLMQNNEKIFDDKATFMTFTPSLLFKNTPRIFKNKKLIIQIEDNVVVHPMAMTMIQKCRNEGYQIAVNDFQFAPRYFSLMEHVDYIKVNISHVSSVSLSNIVKMCKGLNKQCIITGVDTVQQYDSATGFGADYFQGNYVATNLATKAHKTDYLKSNFFNLVAAVNNEEPDVEEIENIISRDAALSYALLKIVNSVYFALRHRTSSIRQALVTLGLGQLKQWVYLLSFKDVNEEGVEDFLRLSFQRATFASKIIESKRGSALSRSDAYLMGMFSTLEQLVDAPMEESLNEIPISEDVKSALISFEGPYGDLYKLMLSYEQGDWKKTSQGCEKLGVSPDQITQMYFDCLEEVNGIWESLSHSVPRAEESTKKNQEIVEVMEPENYSGKPSYTEEVVAYQQAVQPEEDEFTEAVFDEARATVHTPVAEHVSAEEQAIQEPQEAASEPQITEEHEIPQKNHTAKRSSKTSRILSRLNKQ